MVYDHGNQYRCTIIRGKSQKEIDDFLPAYAKIISEICPCKKEKFEDDFNFLLKEYLPQESLKKTYDNHRTEIAGKLFGMYYMVINEGETYVYPSERTMKLLEDNDQPAFFKDVCYKMQFPNGMTKITTLQERMDKNIAIRPFCFILKTLIVAKDNGIVLSKNDIGYYILNNLDVLKRIASPLEVVEQIKLDKSQGIAREIHCEGKASSYNIQHVNEQINYLELANLIIICNKDVILNENEMEAIQLFACRYNDPPIFDVYAFELDTVEERKIFQYEWDKYFGELSNVVEMFKTTKTALDIECDEKHIDKARTTQKSKMEIGDEGETFVYNYEKNRVAAFDKRLANKVLSLGKTKGLGYDIQSVIAKPGEHAEFVKYIEVKSTKRVTEPTLSDNMWMDTLNITRNEWIAAQQHKELYSIFRVYFIRGKVIMYVIENLWQKEQDSIVKIVPLTYRVDFDNKAIDIVI